MAGAHTDAIAGAHTGTAASAGDGTLVHEYAALVEGCGVLDRSERGKLALTGAGAVEFLNGQVTNELTTLRPGEGCYAAFLTHKGKMLGDLRILAVGAAGGEDAADGEAPPAVSELLLDTERVALQALFDMIRRFKVGYDVELHKRTLELALLSLIGPRADQLAGTTGLAAGAGEASPGGGDLAQAEHSNRRVSLDGVHVLAVRTDVGVDLFAQAADAERLERALRERGAEPVSEAAAECLRIERGVPRYGVDMDDSVIPQEAGLNERAVSFTKGCYVGQETVARLFYRGRPNRHLRGLRLAAPAEPGAELSVGDREVGRISSSAVSPGLGPIALALVRREAQPGATVAVGGEGNSAEVVELPFAARMRATVP